MKKNEAGLKACKCSKKFLVQTTSDSEHIIRNSSAILPK
jgi:hypothetical protein